MRLVYTFQLIILLPMKAVPEGCVDYSLTDDVIADKKNCYATNPSKIASLGVLGRHLEIQKWVTPIGPGRKGEIIRNKWV